jgi:hypothetical protein
MAVVRNSEVWLTIIPVSYLRCSVFKSRSTDWLSRISHVLFLRQGSGGTREFCYCIFNRIYSTECLLHRSNYEHCKAYVVSIGCHELRFAKSDVICLPGLSAVWITWLFSSVRHFVTAVGLRLNASVLIVKTRALHSSSSTSACYVIRRPRKDI